MAIDIESIVFPGSANEYQLRDSRITGIQTDITNIKNYDGYGTTLDTDSQNLAGAVNDLKAYNMIIATTDPLTVTQGKIGQLYFNKTTNGLFSCVDDTGGVYTWLPVSSGATILGVNFPLGGYIYLSEPNEPPTGFLKCDGRAISRTTYADLFALIGTTYGPGDGSTTFNIPDFDDTDLFICAVKYIGELAAGPGIVINENTISVAPPLFAQLPVGAKIFWETGNTVPTGYIRCKGQAISRTDYSELFDLWGTTYGSGDGSTTFNVPNFADDDIIVRSTSANGILPAFTFYDPEDRANKTTSWSSTPSDVKYPSEKLVSDSLSYTNAEHFTGKYHNGDKVYSKVVGYVGQSTTLTGVDKLIDVKGTYWILGTYNNNSIYKELTVSSIYCDYSTGNYYPMLWFTSELASHTVTFTIHDATPWTISDYTDCCGMNIVVEYTKYDSGSEQMGR